MQIGMKIGIPWLNQLLGLMKFNVDFTKGVLPSSITFSRSSNGTIINSAGQIAYAPHNLLTNSESFEASAWSKTTTTVTSNAVASPDGATTADTLTATGANSTTLQTFTALTQPYTFSVWIKRKTGTGNVDITVDGTTYVTQAITTSWVRYSTTLTPAAGSKTAGIRIATNTDAVEVYGAQLEIGSTATTYNSTTPKNLLGFTEEFDNAAWTKSNSFVQTNLLSYSQNFGNAYYFKNRGDISTSFVTAPDGTNTGNIFTCNTTSSSGFLITKTSITISSASPLTKSVYLKKGTSNFAILQLSDGSTNFVTQWFNLNTVAVASVAVLGTAWAKTNASIQSIGNGWFRCTLSVSTAGTTARIDIYPSVTTDGGYAGNSGDVAYLWGAQLVQGSTAGDYARTDSTTMPVRYTAPNGYANAQKLVETTATAAHLVQPASSVGTIGNTETLSVYAKAVERSWIYMQLGTGTAYFNVSTGTTGTVSGVTANIISIGNGWYRCSVTAARATNFNNLICIASANGTISYAGDGTSGIYIYGAQLSNSASLDPYVYNPAAALTSVAYYAPRFTYDPVTLAPQGLWLEESRTNLLLNSVLSGGGSAPTSWSFTIGTGTSTPVASTNSSIGVAYSQTATAQRPFIGQSVTLAAATVYTISMIVENVSGLTYAQILAVNGITPSSYRINGQTVLSSLTATTGNLEATFTSAGAGAVEIRYGIGVIGSATGSVTFSCPQLEAGANASTYIPTGASSVTRAADIAVVQGNNFSNWWNLNEGTIYANATNPALGSRGIIGASDGSANNRIALYSNVTDPKFISVAGGSTVADIDAGSITANTKFKLIGAYKLNSYAASVNGNAVVEDNVAIVPAVTKVQIGANQANEYINGTISQFNYYNTRLSNSQLQALTA